MCWHTTATAWLAGVMLADWGHAALLLHSDCLHHCDCLHHLACSTQHGLLQSAAQGCWARIRAGCRQLSACEASKPPHVTCPDAWAACAAVAWACLAGFCCNPMPQWLTLSICSLPRRQGHTAACITETHFTSESLGSNLLALACTAEAQHHRGCRGWMIASSWSPGSRAGAGLSTASQCLRVPSESLQQTATKPSALHVSWHKLPASASAARCQCQKRQRACPSGQTDVPTLLQAEACVTADLNRPDGCCGHKLQGMCLPAPPFWP